MAQTKEVDQDCYELARQRTATCFREYDRVVVSFSGGKDSTAVLNVALEVARELDRLPLEVFSWDEEAIPPETVEYMARVARRPDVRFRWLCLPIEHRNACSSKQPIWYPWAPEDREKWVRPLPTVEEVGVDSKCTIETELEGFSRQAIPECDGLLYPPSSGLTIVLMGIRAQESLTRRHAITCKRDPARAYLSPDARCPWIFKAYPCYDWRTEDVWRAPKQFGWDYNRAYDTMHRAGLSPSAQRCAPPFGDQPFRGLARFKTCWPELWAKMVDRVHGAATAARYSRTQLYVDRPTKPDGVSWQAETLRLIDALEDEQKQEVAKAITGLLTMHKRGRTSRGASPAPMPDETPDPVSGYCWKFLYPIAKLGSNKLDRPYQAAANRAINARRAYEEQASQE